MHYKRWKATGDPLATKLLTVEQRVLGNIDKRTDGCWWWTGTIAHGYGRINVGSKGSSPQQAHRVVYELLVGPIPVGAELDHTCHNIDPACPGGDRCLHRRCVNPAHLDPVHHKTNLQRNGQRQRAQSDVCPKGHPWATNTWLDKNGKRACRSCRSARVAGWKRRTRSSRMKVHRNVAGRPACNTRAAGAPLSNDPAAVTCGLCRRIPESHSHIDRHLAQLARP